MPLTALPPELLDALCQSHIPSHADLVALTETASVFYPSAHRALYRHVIANARLVRTLAERRDLAQFVRSFSLRTTPEQTPPLDILALAISNMTHLVSLDIHLSHKESSSILSSSVSYPRLQHLSCSFSLDTHVAGFLGYAPHLSHLELCPDSDPVSPPIPLSMSDNEERDLTTPNATSTAARVVPGLEQFSGPLQDALKVVPGRPIHSLFLHTPLPPSPQDVVADQLCTLAMSCTPIKILSIQTSSTPLQTLDALLHPSCVHLNVELAYLRMQTSYLWETIPGADFYETMASTLGRFPKLEAFELCGMHWTSSSKVPTENKDKENRRVWQNAPLVIHEPSESDDEYDDDDEEALMRGY